MILPKEKNLPALTDSALADRIAQEWRSGVAYKRGQGYYEDWNEYQRFWEADQWPDATARTRTLPRPVTNEFKSIIEAKVASLTYESPGVFFEPQELQGSDDPEAAGLLSAVAENLGERLSLDQHLEMFARDAALLGSGILYSPWDNERQGGVSGRTAWVGDVTLYNIDPADFFPGDPSNPDMQSQPSVMLTERRVLSDVKKIYGEKAAGISPSRLSSESQVYDHQQTELDATDYVDLCHRWWKERDGYAERLHYAVYCQGKILRREEGLYQHALYPFVGFAWYPRRKSFWGHPESADLINNQKELNRLAGMTLLSAYNTAMPKLRFKEGRVDERDLNNDPGAAIKDNDPTGQQGWGVDYLQPPGMPGYLPEMRESLIKGMREAAGAHEAWQGAAPSSDLNASAIMALQEAAGVRIRGIQRRFFAAVRELGRLWLAHWKEFYTEARLVRVGGPAAGFAWFRGTDYADMEFDVQVKAGSGSPYSKAMFLANLKEMLAGQVITPDEYLELLPEDVFPRAEELLAKRQAMLGQQQGPAGEPPAALPGPGGAPLPEAMPQEAPGGLPPEILAALAQGGGQGGV